MRIQHITHPALENIDYYFCVFYTDDDISSLETTLGISNLKEELSLNPGDVCIIETFSEMTAAGEKHKITWYEKLNPVYFKRVIKTKAEVYSSIYQAAVNFFG